MESGQLRPSSGHSQRAAPASIGLPKINLILAYSGRLPNYFPLYVESIRHNPTIRWTVLCDRDPGLELPPNIRWVPFTLSEFAERVRERLGIKPVLTSAYKLCDFKPTLGFLYPELNEGFEYWGHCDPDILWGDLRHFVNDQLGLGLLKLQMSGAFSLYRNCPSGNTLFQLEHPTISYRQVLGSEKNFSFDEWPGLGRLLDYHGIAWNNRSYMAEILVGRHDLRLHWGGKNHYPQVFEWNRGRVLRARWNEGIESCDEFAYIHLQKRRFAKPTGTPERLVILPGRFAELGVDEDIRAFAALNRRSQWRDAAALLARPWRYLRSRQRFDRSLIRDNAARRRSGRESG